MSCGVRHDPSVHVKVSQIDRPSSGLQDLIRTPTGKDYGYSLKIDREKNDLPAASPDMHGVHDRSAKRGMNIRHRLIFLFFSFLDATIFCIDARNSCVLIPQLAPLTGCTCSRAPFFLLPTELHIWHLHLYLTNKAQKDSFF